MSIYSPMKDKNGTYTVKVEGFFWNKTELKKRIYDICSSKAFQGGTAKQKTLTTLTTLNEHLLALGSFEKLKTKGEQ